MIIYNIDKQKIGLKMIKNIIIIFTANIIAFTYSYACKDPLFEAAQEYHNKLRDVHVDPQYTHINKIKQFLLNYDAVKTEIDATQSFPALKHISNLYANLPTKAIGSWASIRNLAEGLKAQNICEIRESLKKAIENVKSRCEKALKTEQATKELSFIRYCDQPDGLWSSPRSIPHDTPFNITHGGGLFYILRFLSGMDAGYPDEGFSNLGIQVTQARPGSQIERDLSYKAYDYAGRNCSPFDYPAVLYGSIAACDLDAANRGYESSVRTEKRSKIGNIKIKIITDDKNGTYSAGGYDFAFTLDDKNFIADKVLEYKNRLETFGDSTKYRDDLILALKTLHEDVCAIEFNS
jgi:hypothetical protein